MAIKEVDVVLRYKDLPNEPAGVYKPSKKRKKVSYDTQKLVQKSPKKKVKHQRRLKRRLKKWPLPLS